ncbi:MAG: hypothetical protein GWO04_49895, partial [Actinobacteria bacterium]|nr:hypothetical protein [Actinomycetota bacterium]
MPVSLPRGISMHDLVIRDAVVADGRGSPLSEAHVAVDDGRVSEVGPSVGSGKVEYDAGGHVLAPGVIDVHTHYDA